MNSRDINWNMYYHAIKESCPWSSYAFTQGKLLHLDFKSFEHSQAQEEIIEPMKLWAIAYINPDNTPEELDAWCEQRNKEQQEIKYFFSHPEHDPNGLASPIPMLIQQNKYILDLARQGVFDLGMPNHCNAEFMKDKWEKTGERVHAGKAGGSANSKYSNPFRRGKNKVKSISLLKPDENDIND